MKQLVIESRTQAKSLVVRERNLGGHRRDRFKSNNSDIVYYYCKKKGHMRKDYYKWKNVIN